MANTTPQLLDVVALLSDLPAHGLLRGQVGTVVELLDGHDEVEFSDDKAGRTQNSRSGQTNSWSCITGPSEPSSPRGATNAAESA